MTHLNKRHFIGLARLSTLSIASLVSMTAAAQDSGYYYGGLSVGQSRIKQDTGGIASTLTGAGFGGSVLLDNRDSAYKLFGGYQFNRYLALEAGYFNLGKFGFNATTVPAGSYTGQLRLYGVNLDAVATLPITERFSLLARVGAQYARSRGDFSGGGAFVLPSSRSTRNSGNYKAGLGMQYEISPSFLVRGEAERYRISNAGGNKGDVNVFSVSLVFPIGRTGTPAVRPSAPMAYQTPAPAPYFAPAPAAAPMAAPTPPPAPVVAAPSRRRVTFSADAFFSFDQSSLRPDARVALDTLLGELVSSNYDLIVIEGHTDRLGSPAYNQRLSEQRAATVKQYLVASGRIDVAKISTVGKGELEPVAKTGECVGDKPTASLIACLQPDRRVDVDISGTR